MKTDFVRKNIRLDELKILNSLKCKKLLAVKDELEGTLACRENEREELLNSC